MELIGRQFGHLRVTEALGRGGMGEVYAAWDEKLERKVAIKALSADQRPDVEARERLLREARALSKLDHSHICRIHDYVESSDVDLLVLEYIDGKTLREMIEAGSLSRSEKLSVAIRIAEVLVDAHRAGILHRDLKPENVMITRLGEVKVLDFGLARWLGRKGQSLGSSQTATIPIRSVHEYDIGDTVEMDGNAGPLFQGTKVGVTVGTPAYMSPEQARGDFVTPASDMFSFGLLLQTLFTGTDAHPSGLRPKDVVLRAACGDTLPPDGAPHDVAVLIHRLKRIAPADRPTAVETVERLRFLAEKPQRIVRNAIAAAVVLLLLVGGWRYAVDLDQERAIAVAERTEAQQRRAQVEDLLEFMLGDLRTKLEPVGRLDILDDVGRRALAYVSSLDPDRMSTGELVRATKALNQVGEVRVGQGMTLEALALFRRSLQLIDLAIRREPRNADALLVRGATHYWIGNGYRVMGELDSSLAHFRAYLSDADALVSLQPRNREYRMEQAYGHSNVGVALEARGDLHAALAEYESSARIKESLLRGDPTNEQAKADLAQSLNKFVKLRYEIGDIRRSLQDSTREVAIWRELVAENPAHNVWRRHLATSLAFLARSYHALGEGNRAIDLWEEELRIQKALTRLDPTNLQWQCDVANTMSSLAEALSIERGADTLAMHRGAVEALLAIERGAEGRPAHRGLLSTAQRRYGVALIRAGRTDEGFEELRNALRTAEALPRNDASALLLIAALNELARATAASDAEAAVALWTRAEGVGAQRDRAITNPSDLGVWGEVLVRRGRLAEARVVRERLESGGYDDEELKRLCREAGC